MDFNEYKEASHLRYAELARAVSAILAVAIGRESGYRLQLIKERAKQPASLQKKLQDRGWLESKALDIDIKDLAGCRIVFYTDNDVARFLASGIVESNFEVVDRKVHYPPHGSEDATQLYISDHFVVRLGEQRLALPEYAAFAGMQCEVQVQTILNHSWSEMEHDITYKAPPLGDFGAAHFKAIKERLSRVARKYLVPAGYEFQRVASDFERLVRGKKLNDTGALEAIAAAADNNERAEALRVFTEQVLPYLGDREEAYPRVVAGLMAGIRAAQETGGQNIETEYGSIPGKTFGSILISTTKALSQLKYTAPKEVFDSVIQLFPLATDETERKLLLELAKSIAGHNVHVWQQVGPAMQRFVTDQISGLTDAHVKAVRPVLIHMLGEVLSPDAEGTTRTSSTVSFHQASVVASLALRDIRTAALNQLERIYFLSDTEQERWSALASMNRATNHPMRGNYGHELSRIVANDARTVTEFETHVASNLSLAARQATEREVLLRMRRFAQLPEWLAQQDGQLSEAWAGVVDAAQRFNASINTNDDYHIFKVLVGYDSVYLHAWADHHLDYSRDESYRNAEIDRLLDTISTDSFEAWYERIHRYAATESDDLATFPKFAEFIRRVAMRHPELGFAMVERLDERMSPFLPGMLRGLLESDQQERATRLIAGFVEAGVHLENIAWQFRFTKELDIALLRATLDSAIKHDNNRAVTTCILAATEAYSTTASGLVERVFLPAVRYLRDQGDTSWVDARLFSWMQRPILLSLSDSQARELLDAMVLHPNFSGGMEHIAGALARNWPAAVVDWLGRRSVHRSYDSLIGSYDSIPYDVYDLKDPLAAHPGLMLHKLRQWFDADPDAFPYTGGRLLASVFPACPDQLFGPMRDAFTQSPETEAGYVLAILQAYEGKPCVFELVRSFLASLPEGSPFTAKARLVLEEGGVVTGEYGFVKRAQRRIELIEPWLSDESPSVRAFAVEYRRDLERTIVHETRRADQSLAMRRLAHGEDPVQSDAAAAADE